MNGRPEIGAEQVEHLREQLSREAEASGYHLNPDPAKTGRIVKGLLTNEARHGYRSCPCRLAVGDRAKDKDIICPCYYRDADLIEWGACFCGLYVSPEVALGERALTPVPERRPPGGGGAAPDARPDGPDDGPGGGPAGRGSPAAPPYPAWRCRVCGYLCARDGPPAVCPICKATGDRFERYL